MENCRPIEIISGLSKEIFQTEIYPQRKPVILKDVDIGNCKDKWTKEYLAQNGGSVEVKIHVSKTHQMDFIHKNFLYRSLPFSELIRRAGEDKHQEYFVDENEKYYLRALATGDPRNDIADIRKDFPDLAKDIKIPEIFEESQFFSSVLRVASRSMQLWTHYDIMDNILIQVSGTKRVVLFSPTDVQYLYLNGDKSEVLDIDNPDIEQYPKFLKAVRYECILQPGDILFIPGNCFIIGQVTCDNIMEFYADGVLIESSDDWTQTSTVTLPDSTSVLGFYCRDQGVIAGIKGFFSNGIKTDGTWRCINQDIHGWEDPDFDDSAWPLATLPDPSIWGTRPMSLFGQADWIWTAGGIHDSNVYCRKTIPRDQRCSDMLASLTLLSDILNAALNNFILSASVGFDNVNNAIQTASGTALASSILTLEQIDRDLRFIVKQIYDD